MDAARLIREARLARGLNQAGLARRSGTSQTYVSRVERGAVSPSIPTLQRLMHAMGMRVSMEAEPLDPGNSDPRQLRADFRTSKPEDRVQEAIRLSEFLTGLEIAGREQRSHGR